MEIEGYLDFGDTYLERVGRLLKSLKSNEYTLIGNNSLDKFIQTVIEAFNATNRNITYE